MADDVSESKMTNMVPVVEPIFTKMVPCPTGADPAQS